MKTAFLMIALIASITAKAQDSKEYGQFIDQQWNALKYKTEKPNQSFPLPMAERRWLNATFDPIERGVKISRRYHELAESLSRCLNPNGVRVGNWYDFATWASDSANDVINGKKFESSTSYLNQFRSAYHHGRISMKDLMVDKKIDQSFQLANYTLQKTGLDDWNTLENYMIKQQRIFADTNYAIAAEMIPVGEAFLESFCSGKSIQNNSTSNDESFFGRFYRSESGLKTAFVSYRAAMLEKDLKKKAEKILLGSIEQVFYEQARVQNNLQTSLSAAPRALTLSAGFFFGTQGIRLHRNIRVVTLSDSLKIIENQQLKAVFQGLGLESGDPGETYEGSACKNWSELSCRKRYLAPLFRELLIGEPELYEFSK